jgi:LysM domain
MTYYEPPPRRRPQRRSMLDSPVLSALLVLIVLGVVVTYALGQGLLGSPSPTSGAVLPSALGPAPTPVGPSAAPTFSRPTPSPGPTFLTYTVKRGDSLNSIAKKFHTTARSISWWNRGAYPSLDPEAPGYDPNTIRVGWKLVILPGVVVDENNPPTPSPIPTALPTTGA